MTDVRCLVYSTMVYGEKSGKPNKNRGDEHARDMGEMERNTIESQHSQNQGVVTYHILYRSVLVAPKRLHQEQGTD